MKFRNRKEAGKILADRLAGMKLELGTSPIVIGLPRGGVPVAREIASRLHLPLDVLAVKKIGAPGNPEFGIGAVTESGYFWVNSEAVEWVGADPDQLERLIAEEFEEVKRSAALFRGGEALPDLRGRTVILVDDGIATGGTAVVAARFVKSQGASWVILAAPVAAADTLPMLNEELDQVVCVETPKEFSAVGLWYDDFSQTSDEEVSAILKAEREKTGFALQANLTLPEGFAKPKGLVLFAHGSGSSRFSPRNRRVAAQLNQAGFATLLFDLLSEEESEDRGKVFDIPLLAERLERATRWAISELTQRGFAGAPIGYFGASTGAAAALWAAADLGETVSAIVSRGGRPDLAGSRLTEISAATLLIVGSLDHPVIEMNERASLRLRHVQVSMVEGASHLFEEPGTLDEVARLAIRWFEAHLAAAGAPKGASRRAA